MRTNSLVLALVCTTFSSVALGQSSSDKWQFQITPYLWLPSIDGTLNYSVPPGDGGGPGVSVGPTDWLSLINGGLLIGGSARKGRFSVFTDVVYLSMQNNKDGTILSVNGDVPAGPISIPVSADLTLSTRSDLDGLAWTLAAGYTLKETELSLVDVFIGARFFGIDVSTSWDLTADITTPDETRLLEAQGSIAASSNLTDGIVGVRGHVGIGDSNKWSMPFYVDVGAGSSDLTWQATVGLARSYGWGSLMLVYRHLEYDEAAGSLLQDFSFSGPAFGAGFRF